MSSLLSFFFYHQDVEGNDLLLLTTQQDDDNDTCPTIPYYISYLIHIYSSYMTFNGTYFPSHSHSLFLSYVTTTLLWLLNWSNRNAFHEDHSYVHPFSDNTVVIEGASEKCENFWSEREQTLYHTLQEQVYLYPMPYCFTLHTRSVLL